MEKKKLLFVIDSLACDGASKSLVSLLNEFNFEMYDVTLMVFNTNENFFLPMLPKEVKVFDPPMEVAAFFLPLLQSLKRLATLKRFDLVLGRLNLAKELKIKKGHSAIQSVWIKVVQRMPKLPNKYDAVIGYQDLWAGYYVAFKSNARVKIGWNHNDYFKTGRNPIVDKKYLQNLDYLVTVSDVSIQGLKELFPSYIKKLKVINNIISPSIIQSMSKQYGGLKDTFDGVRILTIGRLDRQKGIDIAIEVCNVLVQNGYNIRWYILGIGPMEKEIVSKIQSFGLEERFILLGVDSNPYTFISQADVYVQPSRSEGYGIAVAEAKVLNKPIIVTNLDVLTKQITNNENGIVTNIDVKDLANGIKTLLDKPEICKKFSEKLAVETLGNESEVNKLYKLVGCEL